VVGPITKDMQLWLSEQFGPVAPIAVYHDVAEAVEWVAASKYGLQAAVFGYDPATLAPVVDALAMHEGRVNINAPDKRGPDVLPFTGKKNSALVRAARRSACCTARAHARAGDDEREGGAQALLDPDRRRDDHVRPAQPRSGAGARARRQVELLQQRVRLLAHVGRGRAGTEGERSTDSV
jgi:hypothetical protein